MNDNVIEVQNISKVYRMGEIEVNALRGVSFNIKRGEVVSIMGPSGSGKSTLMNTLGCLDRPSGGEYYLDGELVSSLTDDQLAVIRNKKVGFVFQSFNLLSRISSLANVELPLRYAGVTSGRREMAQAALEAVGLGDRIHHRPFELSGGQQQRVAVARAIINNPSIIMADEPTGNLDTKVGREIMDLLLSLNRERGTTLIIVTHDPRIADQTQRVIRLIDGRLENGQRMAAPEMSPQSESATDLAGSAVSVQDEETPSKKKQKQVKKEAKEAEKKAKKAGKKSDKEAQKAGKESE